MLSSLFRAWSVFTWGVFLVDETSSFGLPNETIPPSSSSAPPPLLPSSPPSTSQESSAVRCSVDSNGEARVTVKHKGEDRVVAAETLCGYLFEHLKDIAQAFAGEPVGRCVLSVPAGFTTEQREALRAVGKQAGLPFSLVVSDSVATAIAYGLDRPNGEMGGTSRDGGASK